MQARALAMCITEEALVAADSRRNINLWRMNDKRRTIHVRSLNVFAIQMLIQGIDQQFTNDYLRSANVGAGEPVAQISPETLSYVSVVNPHNDALLMTGTRQGLVRIWQVPGCVFVKISSYRLPNHRLAPECDKERQLSLRTAMRLNLGDDHKAPVIYRWEQKAVSASMFDMTSASLIIDNTDLRSWSICFAVGWTYATSKQKHYACIWRTSRSDSQSD